jgi:RHS repeat-associated protein
LLTWNARHRLSTLSGPHASAAFTYDPLGRRYRKVIDGTATTFHYDGPNPVQLVSADGTVTRILSGLQVDEFHLVAETGGYRTLLSDALGSTVTEADATATLLTEYSYEPFGRVSTIGPAGIPFQYTGRENDRTGLHYHRARYYHPASHRFISEDPLPLRDGVNPYSYVRNRPTGAVDRFGLLTVIVHGLSLGPHGTGYSSQLGEALEAAGETVVEVHWNGNPLSNEGTDSAIQHIVEAAAAAAASGETFNIVGHSWGSVIAANTLADTGVTAEHLITVGSPLSPGAAQPIGAKDWLNIGSLADPISWGSFGTVADQLRTRVLHTGYWNDPVTIAAVVRRITGRK